jgi:chorismate synthase
MQSRFGNNIRVTIFGGSHEPEIGCIIEGLPADIMSEIDMDELQTFLDRRAPGRNEFSTQRKEPDVPVIRSGDPLTLVIENKDQHPGDYKKLASVPRPGHADFTARVKYGDTLEMSGGGPFSGRMTAPLCIAGGIAKQLLKKKGITVCARINAIHGICDIPLDPVNITAAALEEITAKDFPVFDDEAGMEMKDEIKTAAAEGDSVGGIVEVYVLGCPAGIGGPMYSGVESAMAAVFFGIPAVKGVEFGAGFSAAYMKGSENNDPFCLKDGRIATMTNNCGGILGGITDGMPIIAQLAFKPTPSISIEQDSVDLDKMEPAKLVIGGRHDPCVVLRAVPVAEAAAALAILDLMSEENGHA